MRSTSYTDKHIKWIQENGADTSKTWKEVAEAFGKKFGIKKTANAIRKTFRLYEGYDLSDDELIKNLKTTHSAKKGRSKVQKENKVLLDYLELQEELNESFRSMLQENDIGKVKLPKVKKSRKKKDLAIEQVITDIHVGLKTKSYNLQICEEGMEKFTRTTLAEIDRLEKNYNVTKIQINFLGDLIQGNALHGADSQASCELSDAEQVVEAVRIFFFKSILPIASTGRKISIIGIAGNHDRQSKDRPVVDAGKRYLTWTIYNCMKMLCEVAGLTNVEWDIPVREYTMFEMFNSKFIVEHGHAAGIKPNVKSLESQLLKRGNQLGIVAQGIRIGHYHGSLIANRGRHIVAPSSTSGDCYGDHLGYVAYPALLLNYYVDTKSRESSYYYSFEVNLSEEK